MLFPIFAYLLGDHLQKLGRGVGLAQSPVDTIFNIFYLRDFGLEENILWTVVEVGLNKLFKMAPKTETF